MSVQLPAVSWGPYQNRNLIVQFVRRDIEGRYRGSALGLFWSFVNPLFLLLIYTFVFGVIFRARWPQLSGGSLPEFAIILFCGLIVLNLFSECVSRSPGLIVGSPSYVKKVVFPLEILPVVSLGAAVFHALISLGILIVANAVVARSLPWTILLVPVVCVPLLLLALGASYLLASLGVFVRDLGHVVALVLQILMFVTPVFYPLSAVPERYRPLVSLNPLSVIVEGLRRVTLWGMPPNWPDLGLATLAGAVLLWAGYTFFRKTKRAFADVL